MKDSSQRFVGAGGTPGGFIEFFLGVGLAVAGIFLFLNQVQVHTSFWRFGGINAFGISLIPLLLGIALLFFNGRSIVGWVLTIGGLLFILLGVLANMDIYFERTSLWNTLIMLGLVAAGIGLVFRSLRPYSSTSEEPS